MKLFFNKINALSWYLKYLGVPLTLGYSMCKLFDYFANKKRRTILNRKVVVITGASSGIGEALAHVFYEYGSKVILAARRKTELERVKKDLITKHVPHETQEPLVLELDLANYEHMDEFVKNIYDSCGHIDILINNGGVSHRGSISDTKIDVDKQIMSINYFGSVALTKACLPKMIERKSGHIVLVSSVQGLIAIPDRSAYAASKHAIQAFGDCLRAEMNQHNINVTVISPGYIKTAISINAFTGSGDAHGVMDTSTATGFTPEFAARKMLDAIVNRKNEFVISQFIPNLAITLRHSIPSLYFWIMAKRANKTT